MKSGAPAFGTPEYMKAALVSGQLARRYKLPFRTSGVCAANSADAQSAYETTFALWGAIMGGGNYIKHSAGWLEGGLSASYEKFMIDADMLSMLQEFLTPLEISPESLAFEAVKDVGPGGHFFGTAHTQERYSGMKLAHRMLFQKQMVFGNRYFMNMKSPPWTKPLKTSLTLLLQNGKRKAAHQLTFRRAEPDQYKISRASFSMSALTTSGNKSVLVHLICAV